MDKINIVSLNVRGLNNGLKRRRVFRFLKMYKADMCLLQETYCSKDQERIWASEWGNRCIFSNGSNKSCGVAILCSKKCALSVNEINRDINGRELIVNCNFNGLDYVIANLYAPNEDKEEFFMNVFDKIKKMSYVHAVVGGDFNVVRNDKLDRSVQKIYHPKCKKVIDEFVNSEKFCDIWREFNPDRKLFTYMQRRNKIAWSRIDYFLTSESVKNICAETKITPSVNSDHSMIQLVIDTSVCKRGPGVWKMNETILNDEKFCEHMQQLLLELQKTYAYLGDIELWELIKFEARQLARDWAIDKARTEQERRFETYTKLGRMQSEMVKDGDRFDRNLLRNMDTIKKEIESYEVADAKRSAFRCKKDFVQYGERSAKYYFNLEKRNFTRKTMYQVRKKDGTLTKDYTEILNIQYEYYKELFSKDDNVQFDLVNDTDYKLSEDLKRKLDKEVTLDELYDAQMTLKLNKVPGGDGLGLAFYRRFWNVLKTPLLANFQECVKRGYLNDTGRRGIINLIPKKNKDDLLIRNWRGITLLTYDFKIWAKVIANRLEETTDLINKHQTGFVKGRSIFCNIRTMMEVVAYMKKSKKAGVIVTIDFQSCFDRISHNSIFETFRYFGFGERFVELIQLLYNKLEMCTLSNGFVSKLITKTRGTNQGCPASPLVFNFCGEIMSRLILNNKDIKGLDINGIKRILRQFADDTAAFLNYDPLTLQAFTNTLQYVEEQMGLKVSYEKTTIYRVGSLCKSEAKLYTSTDYKWSSGIIDLLGTHIASDGAIVESNFDEIMVKVKATCSNWFNRTATLNGKVLIINTLMGSLFVYKMMTMTNLSDKQLKLVEKVFREYLWSGKKAKLSLETLQKSKKDGGLRLVNLRAKQDATKISWIFRLDDDPFLAKCAWTELKCGCINSLIWKCNLSKIDCVKCLDDKNFWVQILKAWCKINFERPANTIQVRDSILWYNSLIKIGDRPVIWEHWISKDILCVSDLLNGCSWKSAHELNVGWLEYESLKAAIPDDWKKMILENVEGPVKKSLFDQLYLSKNTRNRKIYDLLISDPDHLDKYSTRWRDDGIAIDTSMIKKGLSNLWACTKITKYRDFQYRLLLKKVVVNIDLKNWKIKNQDVCSFCGEVQEDILHVLYNCKYVNPLVQCFYELVEGIFPTAERNAINFILNDFSATKIHVINFIGIVLKQYIYRCRCENKKPSWRRFEDEIELLYKIEESIAINECKLAQHRNRWSPVATIL